MKIIYCIHSLYNAGGMEKIITEKANAFSELGHQVAIITADQMHRPIFFPLHPSVAHYDLDINYSENRSLLRKAFAIRKKQKKHKSKLSQLLYDLHPDITISTMGNEFLFLYKIKDGSRKILEIHFAKGYRKMRNRSFFWRLIDLYRNHQENIIAAKYDKFVVLTQEDKTRWNKLENIVAIPNYITQYPAEQSTLNNNVCLAVGRLSYQKGFDLLIKSWSIIHRQFPNWKLNIYGEGELHKFLDDLIIQLRLEDTVKIYSPTKQIRDAYQKASIMLVTSRYEGLPMVILEAQSYGLPVISFACKCGPRDLIDDDVNGYLIENNDTKLFAKKSHRINKKHI